MNKIIVVKLGTRIVVGKLINRIVLGKLIATVADTANKLPDYFL